MSTTRNVLNHAGRYEEQFCEEFDFFLDALDEAFVVQARIGLEEDAMSQLVDEHARRFKASLLLVEAANTTCLGALRLLAGNLFADAYALLRVLYETAALLHYMASSPTNGNEVVAVLFGSTPSGGDQSRGEWNLVRKAQDAWETENPGLKPVRAKLNNYGSHLSREKVVLGNASIFENSTGSSFFKSNFTKPHFLMAADLLLGLTIQVVELHHKHSATFPGAEHVPESKLRVLNSNLAKKVRPQLQRMEDSSAS